MNATNRPLSPHIGIYKKQLTSVMSILHRISGVVLMGASIVLVYWLVAAASGPETYARASAVITSAPVMLLMFGATIALFYHLCNGIRHLFWDAGVGFELKTVYSSGTTVIAATAVLTVLTWAIGLAAR